MARKIKSIDRKAIQKSLVKRLKSLLGKFGGETKSFTKDIKKASKTLTDKLSKKISKADLNKNKKKKAGKRDKRNTKGKTLETNKKELAKENKKVSIKKKSDKNRDTIPSIKDDGKAVTKNEALEVNTIKKSQSIGQSKPNGDPINQEINPEVTKKIIKRPQNANINTKSLVNKTVETAKKKPLREKKTTKIISNSSGNVPVVEAEEKVQKSAVKTKITPDDTKKST
ncbi:hypothetical protein H8S90_16845 [Olivibacter sp. SDN3]|uniref:hypothetical protein n=1 Tax=Olivibacter sp. SDN3 TaxID=2764720 RepID=UPI00165123F5|nr:hypothetical protein [Olivibacter sp. SDN3]QNL48450.1 hypothetical protein H8S90_16845 [Olivibacter sp. SDN3]